MYSAAFLKFKAFIKALFTIQIYKIGKIQVTILLLQAINSISITQKVSKKGLVFELKNLG